MIGDGDIRLMCDVKICPNCGSDKIGFNLFGGTTYICRDCGETFNLDMK